MSGAFFVGGVICCCCGHPWWGALLIVIAGRLCAAEGDRPADRTYYRS